MAERVGEPVRDEAQVQVPAQIQKQRESRRQVRGLILLALAAVVFAILRAGVHRVFTPGWWRLW